LLFFKQRIRLSSETATEASLVEESILRMYDIALLKGV
jgi:hypothetical protein